MQISRRRFLVGAGAGAASLALGLHRLRPLAAHAMAPEPLTSAAPLVYNEWTDVWRNKWTWDRVAKGTHTRANCIAAC